MVDFPKDSQKNIDSGEHRIVADLIDYLKQCRHRNVSSRALEMDVVKQPKTTAWTFVKDYLANSNIHGIRYITNAEQYHWVERLWWLLVVACAFGSCSYFIVTNYQTWQDKPVQLVVSAGKARRWDIPFPAITICPGQTLQYRWSSANDSVDGGWSFDYGRVGRCLVEEGIVMASENATLPEEFNSCVNVTDNDRWIYDAAAMVCMDYDEEVHSRGAGLAAAKEAYGIIREMAPQPTDFSLTCLGLFVQYARCQHLFTEVMTEMGLCFTINTLNHEDMFTDKISTDFQHQLRHNQTMRHWSPDVGFSPELPDTFSDTFPYRSRLSNDSSKQFIYVSMTNDQENREDWMTSVAQRSGCDRDVGFYVSVHPPHEFPIYHQFRMHVGPAEAFDNFVRVKMVKAMPQIRKYAVAKRNCLFSDEGQLQFFRVYTKHNCEMECLARMALQTCGCVHFSMPRDDNTPVCSVLGRNCVDRFAENFQQGPLAVNRSRSCGCLAECNSVEYSLAAATMDFSLIDQNEFKSNLILSFEQVEFPTNDRVEVLSSWSFLANCGGLLGLIMGFSLLSVAELMYFLTVRLLVNSREEKRE